MLPWIVGLALLALVIAGLVLAVGSRFERRRDDLPSAVHIKDDTPRHLRQMAAVCPAAGHAMAA
jgi:hypothetical protein